MSQAPTVPSISVNVPPAVYAATAPVPASASVPVPTVPGPMSMTVSSTQDNPNGGTTTTTINTAKPVEPGWQTTEFWQSTLGTLVGLGLIAFGIIKGNDMALQWGAALAGGSPAAYAIGRSIAKK